MELGDLLTRIIVTHKKKKRLTHTAPRPPPAKLLALGLDSGVACSALENPYPTRAN